ncbi:Photosystem II subunit X [Rhynchospora pubera]|uniref:Photosystem II subunit X n=1 Tax=Rhynchospora pubera TaxID=906938 RepID=A0AAV8AM64_9POAL|nr:Photosystem II subunit X [Rhynchospora pubera]
MCFSFHAYIGRTNHSPKKGCHRCFCSLVGPVRPVKARAARVVVKASLKEKALTGATAAALTAAMMVPEIAEAADSGLSPSLKNFLLSIVSGGVVLGVIFGAVIAVANFDPVKRT